MCLLLSAQIYKLQPQNLQHINKQSVQNIIKHGSRSNINALCKLFICIIIFQHNVLCFIHSSIKPGVHSNLHTKKWSTHSTLPPFIMFHRDRNCFKMIVINYQIQLNNWSVQHWCNASHQTLDAVFLTKTLHVNNGPYCLITKMFASVSARLTRAVNELSQGRGPLILQLCVSVCMNVLTGRISFLHKHKYYRKQCFLLLGEQLFDLFWSLQGCALLSSLPLLFIFIQKAHDDGWMLVQGFGLM